jgi:hypothetical protein
MIDEVEARGSEGLRSGARDGARGGALSGPLTAFGSRKLLIFIGFIPLIDSVQ